MTWSGDTLIVHCMGGTTLLTVRDNGDLEIAGDGWKKPTKRTRDRLGIRPNDEDPSVNHVCRFESRDFARRVAIALAEQLTGVKPA